MSLFKEEFLQKYANVLSNSYRFGQLAKLFEVDFQKPWWQVILNKSWLFGLLFFSEMIQVIFNSLTPLILGYAIANMEIKAIFVYIIGYALLEIFNRSVLKQSILYIVQTSQSVRSSAYKFFLTVDPLYHSTKSSGKIISKIDRAAKDFEDGLNQFISVFNVTIGFATVVITVGSFNFWLAIVGITSFVIILSFNYLAINLNLKAFYKKVIQSSDKVSAVSVENLHQNSLIRSSFATNEQYIKLKDTILKNVISRLNFMFSNQVSNTFVRLLYISTVSIMSLVLFNLIQSGQVNPTVGVTLIITYVNGSSQILKLGQTIQNLSEKYASITDLFKFIRNFGKQSYPVLEADADFQTP
jgi:ABC-type bacteriocin/lantibiotic exporter with double-glycine peptidase domain